MWQADKPFDCHKCSRKGNRRPCFPCICSYCLCLDCFVEFHCKIDDRGNGDEDVQCPVCCRTTAETEALRQLFATSDKSHRTTVVKTARRKSDGSGGASEASEGCRVEEVLSETNSSVAPERRAAKNSHKKRLHQRSNSAMLGAFGMSSGDASSAGDSGRKSKDRSKHRDRSKPRPRSSGLSKTPKASRSKRVDFDQEDFSPLKQPTTPRPTPRATPAGSTTRDCLMSSKIIRSYSQANANIVIQPQSGLSEETGEELMLVQSESEADTAAPRSMSFSLDGSPSSLKPSAKQCAHSESMRSSPPSPRLASSTAQSLRSPEAACSITARLQRKRFITYTTVCISGLPEYTASDLRSFEWMGKYGEIQSLIVIEKSPIVSAVVVYTSAESGQLAIQDGNKSLVRTSRCKSSYKISCRPAVIRFCSLYLRGLSCNNDRCYDLHTSERCDSIRTLPNSLPRGENSFVDEIVKTLQTEVWIKAQRLLGSTEECCCRIIKQHPCRDFILQANPVLRQLYEETQLASPS